MKAESDQIKTLAIEMASITRSERMRKMQKVDKAKKNCKEQDEDTDQMKSNRKKTNKNRIPLQIYIL